MAKVRVTFDEETEGKSRSSKVPEGEYGVKVVKAELSKSKQKKTPQLVFTYSILKPSKYKGKKLLHSCNLLPQSLWVLRSALEAMGIPVKSKKKLDLDTKIMVGKKLGVTVEDDEYERDGKERVVSRVTDTYPFDEVDDRIEGTTAELEDDDEDEDDEDESEDDEDESDDEDEEEDDEDEDEDEDDDEDEDEDDEDEEEEPEPVKKKGSKKPSAKKSTSKKASTKKSSAKKGKKGKGDDEMEDIDLDDI